ncbi:MAG: hypothetical protein KA817_01435 [Flavobacteriales bacterium]|nr:hypothetical protein [Flavobacteriales bacterium]
MQLNRKWGPAIALSAVVGGTMFLAACQKENNEAVAPASDAIGLAKSGGGTYVYALTRTGGGSALTLVNTILYRYATPARPIIGPGGLAVDHFTGIAWDVSSGCTWLVTDNNTSNSAFRSLLWRIPGPLPTPGSGGGVITANIVAPLVETGSGATVTDAWDIERDPTSGTIYLLRNTKVGASPRMATLSVTGGTAGEVTNLPGTPPNVQAFTFDCASKLMALKSIAAPPQLLELSTVTGASVGSSTTWSTSAFTAADAGIEAVCTPSPRMMGVNAFVPTPSYGQNVPVLWSTHGSLLNTLDMTSM